MKTLNKIIYWAYAALVFFVPLVFTPYNSELFEFNKIILVYFFTIIILYTWIMKMIFNKKFIFQKTFWDIPLLLYLITQIISTIFSIDRHTSIFGYYSRFNGGLLSTFCYLILYWGLVSNLSKKEVKKLIKFILSSCFLVAIYGIAQHFGIDKNYWVQDVQRRVFSTLGQPNWLAAYLNILIFIIVGTGRDLFLLVRYPLFAIYYTCLLFTKSRSGFLGFIIPFLIWTIINVGTTLELSLQKSLQNPKLKKIGLTILITVVLSTIIGIPFSIRDKLNISFLSDVSNTLEVNSADTSKVLPNITPSSDIRKIVWKGAVELWQQNPIVGTGVETFGYSYYWVRPKEHNLTSEWNFLYNKAHNEFLNYAATTGTLGLTSYLILIISLFAFCLKNKNFMLHVTCYVLLSLVITNIFGFSTVTTSLLFFLLPGIHWICEGKTSGSPKNLQGLEFPTLKVDRLPATSYQLLATLSTTIIFLFLTSFVARYWLADYHYAKGDKLGDAGFIKEGISHINKAIDFNPLEPNFYSELAINYAKIAAYYTQNDQKKEAGQYVSAAVENSLKALQISPYHLNFYKNHTHVYYYLAVYDLDLLKEGIETLEKAEELSPTDPKIPFNLAQMYQTLDEKEKAKEYYQKALELKPNYEKAQTALEELSL
jgi:putative inorganic carbon (hco3(-)) transporter